jgi:hypothetical protein
MQTCSSHLQPEQSNLHLQEDGPVHPKSIYQSINSFKYYLVSVRLLFRTKSWDMGFFVRLTENNISYH